MHELLIFWIELPLPSKHLEFLSFQIVHHMKVMNNSVVTQTQVGYLICDSTRQ